jgi:hypothetical protein
MRLRNLAPVAVLAAVALAGCGGSGGQSNAQQIRGVVNHFTVDAGQDHWDAACKLATGQERSAICGLAKAGGPLTAAQCSSVSATSVMGQECAASQAATAGLSAFTGLVIDKVVISGSSATVAFRGSSDVMTVNKQDGHWLVAEG